MMKRIFAAAFIAAALTGGPACAQDWTSLIAGRYRVYYPDAVFPALVSDAETADARSLAQTLNAYFDEFNALLRLDGGQSFSKPLRVRYFSGSLEFQSYTKTRTPQGSPEAKGALYLHYAKADNCELAVLKGEGITAALRFEAFIQYLRSFIPNPPSWLAEGLAAYFANGPLPPKQPLPEKIPLETVLTATPPQRPGGFQLAAWAAVSFMLNDDKAEYYRAFTDSVLLLSPAASAEENTGAVYRRIKAFTGLDTMQKDYEAYLGR